MGDTAVDFFHDTLKQLITCSKLSLIIDERHQLQSLEDEVKYMRGFLKVTEKKRNTHPEVMKLVMEIRDLVSEAEDIVELFVVDALRADYASYSLGKNHDHLPIKRKVKKEKKKEKNIEQHHKHLSLDLESVKKGMKTLTAEVRKIYDENMYDINEVAVKQLKHSSTGSGGIGGSGSSRGSNTSKLVNEKVVVGFEEEVKRLIEKLAEEGRQLEIISIIGAGGGGKTTLARTVYDHPYILHTFDIRAWIDVSQDYDKTRKRDLLIRILESAIPERYEDYEKSSDDKLGEDILKCLKGRRYLIVMDDIWDIEAWNDIQRSFPKQHKGSKVLFTSRLLVQLDNVGSIPHYLDPLPKNWCWELLQKKVFGMKCCPPALVNIGEQIAEKCKGLPLAVVTIAGILSTEEKTFVVWEEVAKHLNSIIAKNQEGCMEILELSYNHLPLHLKACFLYIGGYPEDKEIPIRELIWLWIAEGFIQRSEGAESLEAIAEGYLMSLMDKSLVQVAKESPLGRIKACRIHDLLRELCLKKAKDDNFLVKVYENDSFPPSATNRRLFLGHHLFQKFSIRPLNLRSFLCLSSLERYQLWFEIPLSCFVQLELLRVLSFLCGPCNGEIGTGDLVHLRYLALKLNWECTTPFSYLLNLETLILDGPSSDDTIPLPRNIFKMVKLRHLYAKKGIFTFHHSSEETGRNDFDHSSMLDSLQTMQRICACELCRSFLVRTPNLRKLGLYGGTITEDNNVLRLLDLEFLKCLETLTFIVDWASHSSMKSTLLPGLKLPLTITRITLKCTRLKWEELSLLQTLSILEVLRLLDAACSGPVWNTSELEGFPQLKYLRFRSLDIEEWNTFEDQFPKLEILVLEYCDKLERIPKDFANLNELREIKLEWCRRSAEESAREIQKEQRNTKGDDDCLNLLPYNNTY